MGAMTEEVYTEGGPIIVDTAWLGERIGGESIVPVDVRPPYFFGQAHLPGAVNLPLFFLQGPDGGPPPAGDFARRLGGLGLTRDTHVVAYDEGGSPTAAILYWALRYYRHPHVSVLDGGITRWRHEGRDWEYSARVPAPAEYRIGESDPTVLAGCDDVLAALGDSASVILDVRAPAEFLGLQVTAQRNGHIPGAQNLEWSNLLRSDAAGLRILRSEEDMRDLLAQAGVTPEKDVIVHCQSGSRSSHTFLVLQAMGFPHVRHYPGGWQEWGNRSDTPVET
jgi:thiosulfate/3-mercaptopyruvate sulfurtransferase